MGNLASTNGAPASRATALPDSDEEEEVSVFARQRAHNLLVFQLNELMDGPGPKLKKVPMTKPKVEHQKSIRRVVLHLSEVTFIASSSQLSLLCDFLVPGRFRVEVADDKNGKKSASFFVAVQEENVCVKMNLHLKMEAEDQGVHYNDNSAELVAQNQKLSSTPPRPAWGIGGAHFRNSTIDEDDMMLDDEGKKLNTVS